MARKVFISVLGAGFYEACKYIKDKFTSSETRFVQQATLEYLDVKNEWTAKNEQGEAIDRIYIVLTDMARKSNWDKTITKRENSKKEVMAYLGLEKVLADMELPCPVETISIPNGQNEEEMWEIFNRVYSVLESEDELYFDLTHSFRYLPMLILVLGNYAKFLKNVSVKHISYGNHEARNKDINEAPLMDILPLTMLQDWTFAAADLIQNGNINRFMELKEKNAISPLMRAKGKYNLDRRKVEGHLEGYIDALKSFLEDMKLCIGPNILSGININRIEDCHGQLSEVLKQVIAPIPPIIDKIQESLRDFETTDDNHRESLINGYEAAKWCYEHQLYQQAITILDENITTHFCHVLDIYDYENSYSERAATNKLLRKGEYQENHWVLNKKYPTNEEILDWEALKYKIQNNVKSPDVSEFIFLMKGDAKWIHRKRNAYNHASMANNEDEDSTFTFWDAEELGQRLQRIMKRY